MEGMTFLAIAERYTIIQSGSSGNNPAPTEMAEIRQKLCRQRYGAYLRRHDAPQYVAAWTCHRDDSRTWQVCPLCDNPNQVLNHQATRK